MHGLRDPFLPARDRHDDLEGRSRRQLRLNGFIEQRLVGVSDELIPLVAGDAHREVIGIERRAADHREDFSGMRIHGDNGPILAFQRLFRGNLQIDVDGQLQRLSGNSLRLAEAANLAPVAVDQRLPGAVLAHQHVVVLPLDTGNANHVAGVI